MKFKPPYDWGRIILLTALLWHIHTIPVTARNYFFGIGPGGITDGLTDYSTCNILPHKAGNLSGSWWGTGLTLPVYIFLPFYLQKLFIMILLGIPVMIFFMITILWLRKLRILPEEMQKRTRKTERGRQIMAKTIPRSLSFFIQTFRNRIKYSGKRINQILVISELKSGEMEAKGSTADVVAFTGKLVREFHSVACEKKQQLVFAPSLPKWKIHFDREKLRKIIYNLLSHTVNYTSGQRLIELFLSKKEYKGRASIEIRIKDVKTGIPADALSYTCFSRAEDAPVRKGADIDLVLVKELVELLDGDITVENILGKGPVFTVRLPVLPAPRCPDNTIESIQLPLPKPTGIIPCEKPVAIPRKNKFKLLIIAGNIEMRIYIRSCIDLAVYSITEATDGIKGIKKAREIVPDLIISDIMMPGKDGFEVTRAIRAHSNTSHIPLILLIAKASEENRLEGISRGADVYLTKPFSLRELSLRIKKLIEIRQLLQRRYQSGEASGNKFRGKKEDRFIVELKEYITRHINDPRLSGGELVSQHFAMSRMQLYRKLKALLNSDISSYVRSVRLEVAMRLLKEKQLNVAEIAYETGFSSPNHFSRTFKKVYGKAPSQIRCQTHGEEPGAV